VNEYHSLMPSEFIVCNSNIIHDDSQIIQLRYQAFSKSELPFYVTGYGCSQGLGTKEGDPENIL
jgi:hypothetical protein